MWLPSKNESLLRLVVLDEDSDVFVYSVTVKEEGLFESTRVATISSKTISESLKAKRQSGERDYLMMGVCEWEGARGALISSG